MFQKLAYIITLSCLGCWCARAQELPQIQSITVQNDTARLSYAYLYNQAGQKTLEVEKMLDGTQWQNTSQVEWLYDTGQDTQTFYRYEGDNRLRVREIITERNNGLPLTIRETDYSGATVTHAITKREYDADGHILHEYLYAAIGNEPERLCTHTAFAYNENNLPETLTVTNEYGTPLYEISLQYDNAGNPLQQILRVQENGSLQNHIRCAWTYNIDGQPVYLLNQAWMETARGRAWTNRSNVAYQYENGLLATETYQYWNVECWLDNMRYAYTYDAEGNLTERALQMPIHDQWRTLSVICYNYSAYPQKTNIHSEFGFWGGDDGSENTTWLPFVFSADNVESKVGHSMEIVYNQRSATNTFLSGMNTLHVYPNPSDGIFYIDTGKYEIESWQVYSLDGSLVAAGTNVNRTGVIDISARQQGIYMLRAESTSGTYITKLIKQ